MVERPHGGRTVVQRIADHGQRHPRVESGGWIAQRPLRPKAEAGPGQRDPGKIPAGIVLARGRQILVADDLRRRDVQPRGEVAKQAQQAGDLRLVERLVAVVVQLDADGGGIEVGEDAPAAGPGVPRAQCVGHQLVDAAVPADQVVRADRSAAVAGAQDPERLCHRIRLGVMQYHQLRPARVVVGRGGPGGERVACRRVGAGGEQGQGSEQCDFAGGLPDRAHPRDPGRSEARPIFRACAPHARSAPSSSHRPGR